MNAPLTPRVEQLINKRLQSGSYKNASEVIERAFDALEERENVQAVRRDLDEADEQLDRGEFTEYDEAGICDLAEQVKARGFARLAEERERSGR
jgi:putative addiction module CopG family antidote